MKYDVENLLKLRQDCLLLKGQAGVELNGLIIRAINIKRDLEEIEKVLQKPERRDIDIMTHARLIKEYGENRQRQIAILHKSDGLLKDVAARLEQDYEQTVKLIKG